MANVQLENGYTRIANELLDVVIKTLSNATHLKIVLVCWRYLYGFQRKQAELSESFIARATGISKRYISQELKVLINAKVIIVIKESTYTSPRILSFNKNYDEWEYRTTVPQVNQNSTVEPEQGTTVEQLLNTTGEQLFHQEKKTLNKTIKKDLSLEIENFRHKFSDFLELVDEYFDILRTTRISGKISDSVILKVYGQMDKHPVIVVKAALLTIIHNPALHSKRENYFYGIMRNTDAAEAERRIQKHEAMQPENQKPNEEYQRIKERLRDGSTGT
jgi:phage replication O-like protein O